MVTVTIGILAFLFSRIDLSANAEALAAPLGASLTLIKACNFLLPLTSTQKWRNQLQALSISATGSTLLEFYKIGLS